MPKITKLYTKKGDDGTTALGGGQRVPKYNLRVQTYGTVDELNSHLGQANAFGLCERLATEIPTIQNELFHLGSDLCFLEEDKQQFNLPQIEYRHVEKLEKLIDELNEATGPLKNFIIPGGSIGSAFLHVARTVCRRAEREVTELAQHEPVGAFVVPYLNRLSDALFAMARFENHERGVSETLWNSRL